MTGKERAQPQTARNRSSNRVSAGPCLILISLHNINSIRIELRIKTYRFSRNGVFGK